MSLIYTIIVLLVFITSLYEVFADREPSKFWYITIVFIMWITAGSAYAISPDWNAYWVTFELIDDYSFGELSYLSEMMHMEMGYLLLNKFVSSIGLGYGAFTLLLAFLALYFKTKTIFNYSGYVFMGLLMYIVPLYFFEEQVLVRQGFANAIAVFSLQYIVKRDLKRFLLCMFIAFLFHKSSVVFIIAYWLVRINFNNLTMVGAIVIAVLINVTGLDRAIDGIMQFMPFGVADDYNGYIDQTVENSVLGDIVKVITVGVVLMMNNSLSKKDELFKYLRNLYIFGVVLYFFFGKGIFAARLPVYYTVYLVFLVPRMVKLLRDNSSLKNFIYLGFISYTMLLYVNFSIVWKGKSGFDNYRTFYNSRAVYGFFKNN